MANDFYTLTAEERKVIKSWKTAQHSSLEPDNNEKMIIQEIQNQTLLHNQNNITRTEAYLQFYLRHPEVHWAFLAHLVSRNGGWNMTDLKGSLLKNVFSEEAAADFFTFLERANAYIFHDAFPQLLLYEKWKTSEMNYFHLLPHFGVSAFMKPVWASFLTKRHSKLLTISLIINEQHYIEGRLISNGYFQKKVYQTFLFTVQQLLHLNDVIFPYADNGKTRLMGLTVSHFAPLEKRIELGKRLYGMLYESDAIFSQVEKFAKDVKHSGSRADYWPHVFSTTNQPSRVLSPLLTRAWENCSHAITREDWYSQGNCTAKFFADINPAQKLDITERYAFTIRFLHAFSPIFQIKNKIRPTGHTTVIERKGVSKMGQNHQFKPGQKAPNNGYYVEIGETGSTVNNPKQIKLEAGEKFPDTQNQNRVWMPKRKP